MKLLAIRYDRQGSDRREAGDAAGAIRLFKKAIQHAPKWSVPWYNLGLTYKYAGNWAESYRCNAMAAQLNPKDEAAIWNMGIAATAFQDWAEARRAWKLYGIDAPMGDGPIEMDLGSAPIRLNPEGTPKLSGRVGSTRPVRFSQAFLCLNRIIVTATSSLTMGRRSATVSMMARKYLCSTNSSF